MTHETPCYNEAEKAAGRGMKQGLSPREVLEKAGARMADEDPSCHHRWPMPVRRTSSSGLPCGGGR
ncbi:hypothetical protein NQF86_02895 [Bombella sp. TMW 2.2543]|uniref:Uncharacterized protein n=1 Tax=Bombella pluederhausensis TaxID=2967336 RepID=A0ABT3WET6_9PROT|nr:hypothetical protein [Bombella pluederhausensis]MCX5617620.1 hypothetical protein [Bombella pluederhausensis]